MKIYNKNVCKTKGIKIDYSNYIIQVLLFKITRSEICIFL